ncbi:MAG TPA: ATP-binding cassette domain-containing protein, partial [Phycisphaerales bacterium]|nr:ATP-binding cassette domain-containing protein [Phycisphaerales bacterium]
MAGDRSDRRLGGGGVSDRGAGAHAAGGPPTSGRDSSSRAGVRGGMSKILSARKLFKTYRLGAARIEVLKGVDLAVEAGQFVAVVGASGSGKSTLLHLLGALDRPDSGQVFFENRPVEGFSAARLNRFRNRSVGFVFQFYHLLDELTVLENTLVPAMAATGVVGWLRTRGAQTARARALLGKLGLADRLRHKPYQLSGGERQRVAIARALMNA